tara:strand:- start:114 stop:323 length:210 start_codon:yes stop_codon:yes gene_type:complete
MAAVEPCEVQQLYQVVAAVAETTMRELGKTQVDPPLTPGVAAAVQETGKLRLQVKTVAAVAGHTVFPGV